jgi:hypothetical protein
MPGINSGVGHPLEVPRRGVLAFKHPLIHPSETSRLKCGSAGAQQKAQLEIFQTSSVRRKLILKLSERLGECQCHVKRVQNPKP